MGDGFLSQQIRRNGRNNLILGLFFAAAIATVCGLNSRNLYNFFRGPFPVSSAEITSLDNPDSRRQFYVTVQGGQTFSTGIEEKETVEFFTSHHPFLLTVVGDKLLLVKAPGGAVDPANFKGALIQPSADLQSRVIALIVKKNPELAGHILPVMLDGTYFDWATYTALGLGAVFFVVACILVLNGAKVLADSSAHPIWKTLAQQGSPQQVGSQLDAEIQNEGGGQVFGDARLTTNWLVGASTFSTQAVRVSDVVWAYQRIVKHYQGFIPVRKSFSVKICARDGRNFEIQQKKDSGVGLLQSLKIKTPWIAFGFTPALESLWRKNRAEFISAVDQRKSSAAASPAKSSAQQTKQLVGV
jgi:hypothetical protein